MAQVDFSNAHIVPFGLNPLVGVTDVGLNSASSFFDFSGNNITSSLQATVYETAPKYLIYRYTGTFSASGNEIYIHHVYDFTNTRWKISNISFNSGDTFDFKIKANII